MISTLLFVICFGLALASNMTEHVNHTYTVCQIEGFNSFNCKVWLESDYSSLYVHPHISLILDKYLNLSQLVDRFMGPDHYPFGFAYFYDIGGFDLNLRDNSPITLNQYVFLELRFNIFNNSKLLDPSCKSVDWMKINTNSTNLFNYFQSSIIIKNSVFPSQMCPSVFHGFDSDNFEVFGQQIKFDAEQYPFLNKINSTIRYFYIRYAYKLDLNNNTLHPRVFNTLQYLQISQTSIYSIQIDVFKDLTRLRTVNMLFINLRYFYHFNQITWMSYLNRKPDNAKHYLKNTTESIKYVNSTYVKLGLYTHAVNNDLYPVEFFPYFDYRYPDEDFCLFVSFPHENLLLPIMQSNLSTIECTCTLRWILKNQKYFRSIGIIFDDLNFAPDQFYAFNSIEECDTDQKRRLCEINGTQEYKADYFTIYDLKDTIKSIQTVSLNIFGPITSTLALLTNILTTVTVYQIQNNNNHGNKLNTNNNFYRYMKWNGVLNTVYSVLFLLFYSIVCDIKSENNHGEIEDTCFQEQIYVNLFGNILKLMSNFFFLQMCLNRFVLVGKDHNERVIQITEIRPKWFFLWSGLFSVALNVVIYFQQQFFGNQSVEAGRVLSEVILLFFLITLFNN